MVSPNQDLPTELTDYVVSIPTAQSRVAVPMAQPQSSGIEDVERLVRLFTESVPMFVKFVDSMRDAMALRQAARLAGQPGATPGIAASPNGAPPNAGDNDAEANQKEYVEVATVEALIDKGLGYLGQYSEYIIGDMIPEIETNKKTLAIFLAGQINGK